MAIFRYLTKYYYFDRKTSFLYYIFGHVGKADTPYYSSCYFTVVYSSECPLPAKANRKPARKTCTHCVFDVLDGSALFSKMYFHYNSSTAPSSSPSPIAVVTTVPPPHAQHASDAIAPFRSSTEHSSSVGSSSSLKSEHVYPSA